MERLHSGGANMVGKQHFTLLYSRVRTSAFTPRNIKSGRCKAGLYLFDIDKVLGSIQKPLAEETVPQIANVNTELVSHHDITRTPVTWESLTHLRTKFEQETALNSPSKHRFQ